MKGQKFPILALVISIIFVLAVPLVAAATVTYSTQLSVVQPAYSVNFSLDSTNTDAKIFITLAQGTTWTSLSTQVGVGPGASVQFQLTDPNGIVQGTNVASGAPNSLQVSNPVPGQWLLRIGVLA